MFIEVINCKDDKLIEYIHKAIIFYGELLISKMMLKNIDIEVIFDNDLNVLGGVTVDEYNKAKKARGFLIEISGKLGAKSVLQTLAHEMVHVKQHAYGEITEKLNTWKGKYVNCKKVDYYNHPWEIEAYGREQGLFCKFVVKESLWEIIENIGIPDTAPKKEKMGWKIL